MKFFLIALFFCANLNPVFAQQLTGTWHGVYNREMPTERRSFFYRMYLQHRGDSLFGICELLGPDADVRNLSSENTSVISTYKVYNFDLSSFDGSNFELTAERTLFGSAHATYSATPSFELLLCFIESTARSSYSRSLLLSNIPAVDGALGKLSVRKVSDSIPDLPLLYLPHFTMFANTEKAGSQTSLFNLLKIKLKKAGRNSRVEQKELPMDKRLEQVQASIEVASNTVTLHLFDHGEEDNDIVSVFLNNELVVNNRLLSSRGHSLQVILQPGIENKIVLVAHNLGKLPPNTASLLITNDSFRHEINLTSSLQTNAVVLISVKPKEG